jgi:hypothetical protein
MGGTLWRNSTQEEGCTGHSFIHIFIHKQELYDAALAVVWQLWQRTSKYCGSSARVPLDGVSSN